VSVGLTPEVAGIPARAAIGDDTAKRVQGSHLGCRYREPRAPSGLSRALQASSLRAKPTNGEARSRFERAVRHGPTRADRSCPRARPSV